MKARLQGAVSTCVLALSPRTSLNGVFRSSWMWATISILVVTAFASLGGCGLGSTTGTPIEICAAVGNAVPNVPEIDSITPSRYNAHVGWADKRLSEINLKVACNAPRESFYYVYTGENPTAINPWNSWNVRHPPEKGWWFTNDAPTFSPLIHRFMWHLPARPIGSGAPMSPLAGVFGQPEKLTSPAQLEPTAVHRLYSKRSDNKDPIRITLPNVEYWGGLLIRGKAEDEYALPVHVGGLACMVNPIINAVLQGAEFEHSQLLGERIAHAISFSMSFPNRELLPPAHRGVDSEPLLQIATLIEIKGPANIGRGGHLYVQIFVRPSCEDGRFRIRYAGALATGNDSAAFQTKLNTEIGPMINQALDAASRLIGDPTCKDIFMLPFDESDLYRVDNPNVDRTFAPSETSPTLVIVSDGDFDPGVREAVKAYDMLAALCPLVSKLLPQ